MKTPASGQNETEDSQSGNGPSKPAYDLIAMTASAGGLRALIHLLEMLPDNFPCAIVVVQHLDRHHPSMMAPILNRRTSLVVKQAESNELIQSGCVYIAPPDRHLLVNPDLTLSLSQAELVHFVRPSGDLLFESVAAVIKDRAIAVVLTGTGVDGTTGVQAIKKMGGIVIAQDEATSDFFGMPGSAIQTGCVDYVLPLDQIAPKLTELVNTGGPT
jgi:two-component system chemotaxis response regulator CheB